MTRLVYIIKTKLHHLRIGEERYINVDKQAVMVKFELHVSQKKYHYVAINFLAHKNCASV